MATPDLGAQWLEALGGALSLDVEEVPEDWLTIKQVAEVTGYSEQWAYKQVEKMVEKGVAEKRRFRIQTGSKTSYPVTHYRIIDEA